MSLDIKINYAKKVDREQQTPQDGACTRSLLDSTLHPAQAGGAVLMASLRFADESSSVIHAGITPPDDGSSAMSASDFRYSIHKHVIQLH